MRVLMIEWFLPESTYTLELTKELNVDLTIVCRRGTNIPQKKTLDILYQGGEHNKLRAAKQYLCGLMRLKREILSGNYNIVHVQGFKDAKREIPFYEKLKKQKDFPLVHTVHNLLPHEATETDKTLYGDFYKDCDLLVVHNQWCKTLLMQDYGISEEKILVTPHGHYSIETEWTNKGMRTNGNWERYTNFLLFGLFRKYKGIDILLHAIAQIPPEKRRNMHWTIAGNQFKALDDTDYSKMIWDLGIQNSVSLEVHYIPENALPLLFGNADYAVFPYREIYGSGALLMAMTFGKLIITSDIPVFKEETNDGEIGFLFASENSEDLARVMIEAHELKQKEYEKKQQKIRKLLNTKYNWKFSDKLLVDGYRKIFNQ